MENVSWSDPRVVVAIYAAIIATITFIWKIIEKIANGSKKLSVSYRFFASFIDSPFERSPVFALLGVEITNIGKKDIHVKNVSVYLCGKKVKSMGIETDALGEINKETRIKYPYLLRHGELLKTDFGIENLCSTIENQLGGNDKLCIEVRDTVNKRYYSKKFYYKEIKNVLDISIKVNKRSGK